MRWTVLLVIAVAAATGCSGSGRPIEYIVPDGHRGRVWVLYDPAAPELPVVDGRYRATFPADGVLRVGSMRPFGQWHETTARYTDGTPLPATLISGSSQVAPDTVGMWGGTRGATWPDKRDYIVWVVGTEAEYKAVGLEQFAPPTSK